MIGKINKN